MNWAIKIISKTLMTEISHILWGVTTKGVTIIGFFNFQFLVTHVTTAITCVTRVFTLFPIYLG